MNTITTPDCVSERSILMSILRDMRLVATSTEGKGPTSLSGTRQMENSKLNMPSIRHTQIGYQVAIPVNCRS